MHARLRIFAFLCVIGIGPFLAQVDAQEQAAKPEKFSAQQIEFFESKVRPLLVKHCYECHGPKSDFDGGLSLASRADLLKGETLVFNIVSKNALVRWMGPTRCLVVEHAVL